MLAMILIVLADSKLARNLPDLFYVKYVLKYLVMQKNVTIVINYSVRDALKIGYN